MAVRYTVCTYYPDLTQPQTAFPFAVLAASPKDIALVGVNVGSARAAQEKQPLAMAVSEQTFDIVVRRIHETLQRPGLDSCLDVLDCLAEDNRSNIQYRSFHEVDADEAKNVAELVFAGTRQQWDVSGQAAMKQEVRRFHQMVLRLDEQDREAAISGMPGYTVYGLRNSAAQLIQSATVVYRGLRREGALQRGFAFCGRLHEAFDNAGNAMDPPPGMVFVVYADPDGYVFDWDWVEEDPHNPGYPVDAELRFTGNPETIIPEAVLVGVDNLAPASFDSRSAWPSLRGDCIFCYFSGEFAYADRINNDLTVFRSLATKDPTGFKIKNVERIREEGIAQMIAPDLKVIVRFLLATFRRNPNTSIEVYSFLIGAWMSRVARAEHHERVSPLVQEGCGAKP